MFDNFTQDQKTALVLILVLSFFAIISIMGAALLFPLNPIIAFLLLMSGAFLGILAAVGTYVEFIEKD